MGALRVPRRDLTGLAFGLWTVVAWHSRQQGKSGGKHYWLCRCACGRECVQTTTVLTSGRSRSCGCMRRAANGDRPWLSNFNVLLSKYQRRAHERGLAFSLDDTHALALFRGTCYYCGAEPANIFKESNPHYPFVYSGIDRLDNTQGYAVGNVVSCCATCNRAKDEMPHDEYVAWVLRSADHLRAQRFSVVPISTWEKERL